MSVRIHIRNEAFAEAVEYGYADGLSFSQIAAQTGRSRSAVAGKARRLGLHGRGAGCKPRSVSAKSNALGTRIAALHADGLTSSEIGIALGMEIRSVRCRLQRSGLSLNPPKPSSRRSRPIPPDQTPPTAGAGALQFRRGAVDLTPPPETSVWFADPRGCRFSCWPTTEHDPMRKRCCGAAAVRGAYCDYHASVVYAPATSKRAA